jgi:hypothetical protein
MLPPLNFRTLKLEVAWTDKFKKKTSMHAGSNAASFVGTERKIFFAIITYVH